MTAPSVMEMVKKKKEEDYEKFLQDEKKRKEREAKEERRRLSALRFNQKVYADRLRRQATLAHMSVEELTLRRRTLKERRAVAKLRTEARRSLPSQ